MDILVIAVYLAALAAAALRGAKKVRTVQDFSLSDRKYGVFVMTASLSASFIGGGFCSGNAAAVAEFGIGNIVALCGFSLGMFLIGRLLLPRLCPKSDAHTVGGLLGAACGRQVRTLGGLFSFLTCTAVLGAQLAAIGHLFAALAGIPAALGAALGCAAVIAYSTAGGMKSVISADAVQFVILAVGIPALLFFSVQMAGGVGKIAELVPSEQLDIFNGRGGAGLVSLFLTMLVGESLSPPFVQRVMMCRDANTAARACRLSGLVSVPFFAVTGLIGLVGSVCFAGTVSADEIMYHMVRSAVPVGARGLIIAAMLSVVVSSADAFLNSGCVSLWQDVILPRCRTAPDARRALTAVRSLNVLVGAAAYGVAMLFPSVLDALTFAYRFWAPVVLPPLAAALLGCKMPRQAALRAMLAGASLAALFAVLGDPFGCKGVFAGTVLNALVLRRQCRRLSAAARPRQPRRLPR